MALERLDSQVEWLAELGLIVLAVIGVSAAAIPLIVYWRRRRSERRHRKVSEQRRGADTHIDLFNRESASGRAGQRPQKQSSSRNDLAPKTSRGEVDKDAG